MATTDAGTVRSSAPAVPEQAIERAVQGFSTALGKDKVFTDEATLREFHDPYSHPATDPYVGSVVVMPTSVEEVQAVLRVANETEVPLWTHSTGRNNGYGGGAPRVPRSVIVSLRNMNRVLEINEQLGYALVEPGVRWFDLYQAIQAGGHKLTVSVPDLGWGSVVGNTLDHGMSYMPYGVDQSAQCGMEVVLADGTVMRTGMGAMEGNRAWNCYKRGLGPTPDQLFMQSNFGIVTKMGYWLMPEPEVYMPLWLKVPHDDDLASLIDTLRQLMLDDTIRMVPQIGNVVGIASAVSRRTDWWQGAGPISEERLQQMADDLGAGRWTMRFALYGDEAVVDHRFTKVKAAFETAIPGAVVSGEKYPPSAWASLEDPGEQVQAGVPNLGINAMTAWYDGEQGGHVGFSPVAPLTGADALAVRDLLRSMIEEAGLDYFAGIVVLNARSFAHVTLILFDTQNPEQVEKAYSVSRKLVVEAGRRGYGEYRAHLDFMDLAADQYGFNQNAYRRFNERIKDTLDPNGILAPGKQGIWPARMRGGAC